MKGLFKPKPLSPPELVRHLRELLNSINPATPSREPKKEKYREEKMSEFNKCILEMRSILYGIDGAEPVLEACAQLTQEFMKEDTIRLLIVCLPKLDLGARQNATRVITNLSRQRIDSRSMAAEYLENNLDLINILILGYEDSEIALSYGPILRECIRCQSVARYVLESAQMKNFFDYVQNPNFEISSDAAATFKELLTRHKSTVAEFLSKNFDWFFQEYNSQLLQSPNYITRRHAVKLLGDMLLDRSNSAVMIRYVSSLDNMRILMNLLREPNKAIQLESFHVFKKTSNLKQTKLKLSK